MTVIPIKPYLIDGPLMLAPERKEAMARQMATHLAFGIYADRERSVRTLHRHGYACQDIDLLVDDARQVAMQEIVAREMASS